MAVQELAARLDDRFRLLTNGNRTALPRHQTLRALIDWSCDLLAEEEQTLLRRLSVFAGGWTLEAAEWMAERETVLDLLTQLVNKSHPTYAACTARHGMCVSKWNTLICARHWDGRSARPCRQRSA
jgi:predicted ATPase